MASKKQGRRTSAVVTSRKVVEKTVQVVVTPGNHGGGGETEKQQPCSASNVAAEVVSLLSKEEPTVQRTVSVECNAGDPPAARMRKKRKRAAGGGGEAEYKRYVYSVYGVETGSPGLGDIGQGHGGDKQSDGGHVREDSGGGGGAGEVRLPPDALVSGDSGRRQAGVARRAREACRRGGSQGRRRLRWLYKRRR
ncbi:unnamed protein product [Cuscuta campestris]|uniref:Uncharacterized protein n=1 Tax=Cuscuta campestris TaxID=132261 RepID=A0A484LPE5_9ASTE|nr:unnamed protein product [Cuscuta campestris]